MSHEKQGDETKRVLDFAIQTALRYRVRGERNWHDGVTENISRTYVIFRGEQMVPPDTAVELTFTLPLKLAAEGGVKVMCRGVTEISEQPSMISVRISRLRLLRP